MFKKKQENFLLILKIPEFRCKYNYSTSKKLLYLVFISHLFSCENKKPAEKPNIIYILADDLGWADVKVYNSNSKIPTPHMDSPGK